ncbi:MAG TPA: ferritin-like domain-containing protein [Polyangiaceae bacterium]|nr:ferritin-like domain-containing protein [Polyangiaceae bacterium]
MNYALVLRMRLTAAAASGAAMALGGCQVPDRGARQEPPPPPEPTVATAPPSPQGADLVAAEDAPEPQPTAGEPVLPAPTASAVATTTPIAKHPPPTPGKTCATPKRRCVPPNAQVGQIPPSPGEYDLNGCLSGDRVSGACEGFYASKGPVFDGKQCCYVGCTGLVAPCGRALLVAGKAHTAELCARNDWSRQAPDLARRAQDLSPALRTELAAAWRQDALLEHASIAAFANFVLELASIGAPALHLESALTAAQDEVRHAQLCFGLADAFAGNSHGPGPLQASAITPRAYLPSIVAAVVEEACCAETAGALLAARQLEHATDPSVRAVLSQIVEDETRHAEAAFRFVSWALGQSGPELRATVDAAFARGVARLRAAEFRAASPGAAEFGRLDPAASAQAVQEAIAQVIEPSRSVLLTSQGRAGVVGEISHSSLEVPA